MPPSLGVASCGDDTGTLGLGITAACPAGTWDSSASLVPVLASRRVPMGAPPSAVGCVWPCQRWGCRGSCGQLGP